VGRTVKFIGLKKVMRNLNKEILKIKGRSMIGLIEAAIIIRRDMEKTPPLTPVDLGNLRASFFITTGTGKSVGEQPKWKGDNASTLAADHSNNVGAVKSEIAGKPVVALGFSANYAGYVHETKGSKNWKRTSSGPKFLESALNRNHGTIIKAIKDNQI